MARREYQRQAVGECDCPECGRVADVRKDKRGNLYIVCLGGAEQDGCGKLTPNTRHGQARLEARTRFFKVDDPEPAPLPVGDVPGDIDKNQEALPVDSADVPDVVPEQEKTPVPDKPRGFFDRLINNPVI